VKLHLKDIKAFSDCPALFRFSEGDQVLIPRRRAVIESVIKKCYIQATETGYRTSWRSVVGWVDADVFAGVDIDNDENFRAAKALSTHILSSVQKWYSTYMEENFESYADLDLYKNVGDNIVAGTAPIIHSTDPVTLTIFKDLGITRLELYNDLEVRGLGWLIYCALEGIMVNIRTITVGPQGGLNIIEVSLDEEDHKRTESVVKQVLRGIRAGLSYPSRTEQCRSCKYLRRCLL